MKFTPDDIRRIKDAANGKLLDVIGDFRELRRSGKDYVCDCPRCGGKEKFSVSPAKGIFKCWSCPDIKGADAVSYLMKVEGMEFIDAMDYLAKKFTVILDAPTPPPSKSKSVSKLKKQSRAAKGQDVDTFCARMLAESGLTYEDVTAKVYKADDKQSIFESRTFRPGTVDEYGNIVAGDDVIIEYYDLDGLPVTYQRKLPGRRKAGNAETKEYYRVRWQFPQEHLDKDGRPFKYKSPAGSGTPVYIPERLRRLYKEKQHFSRLYIQEGEKKAEKACKHGLPSIAISGIQNLGQKGALPEDLVKIIATCGVSEVALLFDADWNDLSQNIRINKPVEQRPASFFAAARNFKEYMRMLKNRGILVEVFIGHVQKNEAGDKGVDDLLANSLKGQEEELVKDIEFACNEKSGQGRWVAMHKITTWNDYKLKELWCLHSHEKFAELHRDVLAELPEFLFGRYAYKFQDGKVVSAMPFEEDEKFWTEEVKEDRNGNQSKIFEYNYVAARNFFQNRGIGRYRLMDTKLWSYIHLEPPVVETIDVDDARDFMFSFAEQNCSMFVNNALLKGGSQFVGPFQMSRLHFIKPNFIAPSRDEQYFYFRERCWRITQAEVKEVGYESINHHIWAEQKKDVDARYLGKPLITFSEQDGRYSYQLSKDGAHCHYLRFLINASNFTWRKKAEEVEEAELYENNLHLLSKLCAIGYLLMEAKDNNVTRAVVGMDGKQSEVGESNGRSGKSLIGELMRQVMPIAYLPGKKPDLLTDQFVWNDVDEKTRLVFIDDVLQNFNFEFLFPNLTGDWTVNKKGGTRITYPFSKSPKIYLATNHAIRGTGSSFTDRQWLIAFSDFYNDTHKPLDDFGVLFFSEWDFTQWNLCWNLLANCIQLYLTYGVIQAPGERLEQRKLRQEIGELFISWADEYFSSDEHLNHRLVKKELYDALINYDPAIRKYIQPPAFKKKLTLYCKWKGYIFNPQKYDPKSGKPLFYDKDGKPIIDDKSGGVEYVTVGTAPNADVAPATDQMGLPVKNNDDNKLDF